MLVCIVGYNNSGKSTAAAILGKMGYRNVEMSSGVFRLMKEKGIEPTLENIKRFAEESRARHGKDVFARIAARSIRPKGRFLITGMRNVEELDYFESRFSERFLLIAIVVPSRLRRGRAMHRTDGRKLTSYKEFKVREETDRALGLERILKRADTVIHNTGTRADLRRKLISAIKERG